MLFLVELFCELTGLPYFAQLGHRSSVAPSSIAFLSGASLPHISQLAIVFRLFCFLCSVCFDDFLISAEFQCCQQL